MTTTDDDDDDVDDDEDSDSKNVKYALQIKICCNSDVAVASRYRLPRLLAAMENLMVAQYFVALFILP